MRVDVGGTLRQALAKLTAEKERLDRQIDAIAAALHTLDGGLRASGAMPARRKSVRKTKRRTMSKAEREAVGDRMKAYWAKRRSAGKSKGMKRTASREER